MRGPRPVGVRRMGSPHTRSATLLSALAMLCGSAGRAAGTKCSSVSNCTGCVTSKDWMDVTCRWCPLDHSCFEDALDKLHCNSSTTVTTAAACPSPIPGPDSPYPPYKAVPGCKWESLDCHHGTTMNGSMCLEYLGASAQINHDLPPSCPPSLPPPLITS